MKFLISVLVSALLVLMTLFEPAIAANPPAGDRSFTEYEAYLHPAQEADPELKVRIAYGKLRFPRDLSCGNFELQVSGVDAANVTAFHIHCGAPGVLEPIIVDFSQ